MAVRTKEELITSITTLFGDDMNDERISFLDDFSDSFDSFSNDSEIERLKQEKDELDASWRKRYVERFSSPVMDEDMPNAPEGKNAESMTFNDLFKMKG